MNAKRLFLALAFSVAAGNAVSQTQELTGFKSLSKNSIYPIFEKNETKGYVMFYKSDKADKENDNYHLTIYDENLVKTKTINMAKPRKKFLFIGEAYNGSNLGFFFYNFDEDRFELASYDKTLTKVASVNRDHKLTNMEKAALQQKQAAMETDQETLDNNLNIFAVPGNGFITNGIQKNGKGYTLEMFDNSLKTKWKYETPENSDEYEALMINEINDRFLIGNLVKRPGLMSKKMNFFIIAFDVKTGKKVMEIPVESKASEQLSLNTISYDDSTHRIVAIGDYYDVDGKPGVSKSKGFYFKSFDSTGKEVNKKFYSWAKDVKSLMPAEGNESLEHGAMNYVHKIMKSKDGKFYVVCEQFSKAADALGIASNVLGMMGGHVGGAAVTKAVLWNMVIYVMNPDLTLSEVKVFTKDKSSVTLPPGADFYGPGITGMFIKAFGAFDYQFSQKSNDGKNFIISYVNYDKEKGEGTKRILGNIIIGPDGKMNVDKIDITKKSTAYFLYPAKPGYVMMVDFLKKEKTVGMKLMKMNY